MSVYINNTWHRFSLSRSVPAKKYDCPYCGGRKCFTYYIDNDPNNKEDKVPLNLECVDGEYILGRQYGCCDHKNSCGANHGPKEFFADRKLNPSDISFNSSSNSIQQNRVQEIIPIPIDIINQSMYKGNKVSGMRLDSGLHKFLFNLFNIDIDNISTDNKEALTKCESIINVLCDYLVGVCNNKVVWDSDTRTNEVISKERGTVFWLKDVDDRVRTGKQIWFNTDGHRDKNISPGNCNYALSKRGILPHDYHVAYCLFGEHLLNNKSYDNKTVCIVESEKSAIIGTLFKPQFLWLACQSKQNLNERFLAPLKQKNRKVTVVPDLDGYYEPQADPKKDEERRKMSWDIKVHEQLVHWYPNISCNMFVKNNAIPEDGETCDIADIFVRLHLHKTHRTELQPVELTEQQKCEDELGIPHNSNSALNLMFQYFDPMVIKKVSYEQ